jgi:hypothetical protein
MGERTASTAPRDVAAELCNPYAPQWGNTPASAQLCVKRARTTNARTVAAADVVSSSLLLGAKLSRRMRVQRDKAWVVVATLRLSFLPVLLRHYICNPTSLFLFSFFSICPNTWSRGHHPPLFVYALTKMDIEHFPSSLSLSLTLSPFYLFSPLGNYS